MGHFMKIAGYFRGGGVNNEKERNYSIFVNYIIPCIIFVLSIIHIIKFNITNYGQIYLDSPDGNLYLSIAKNFWSTGHFIQSSRPYEINMVVPFGLPLIYTILCGQIWLILVFQMVLFGMSGVMIYRTVVNMYNNKIGGIVSGIIGSIMYYININVCLYANPGLLLTEAWTMFGICFYIFLLLKDEDKESNIYYRLIVSFIMFVIRPVYVPFFLFTLIELMFGIVKKKYKWKKSVIIIISFIFILLINVVINYREINNFCFLENYAGEGLYLANNPSTRTDITYSSDVFDQFVDKDDKDFFDIYNNNALTRAERSELCKKLATEYIKNNIGSTLYNTLEKFKNYFIDYYGFVYNVLFIFFAIFFTIKNKSVKVLFIDVVFIIIGLSTSMGLIIYRYGIFAIPMYLISTLGFVGLVVEYTMKGKDSVA